MQKTFVSGLNASAAIAAVCFMFPAAASAQDAPQASATGIETIVVTAQKREQSAQDVPISMTVLSGSKIADFHNVDMKDVSAYIPNLYVERLNAADVIYIRGFGSAPANFAFDQSVSMYVDGVYAGRGRQFEAPFFDIARVEVMRGPQGALFGKNTAAGAISIVTAGPTDTFQANVTADYDFELKGVDLSGYVSGPITDELSARLAVKVLNEDGYIKNETTGAQDPRRRQAMARLSLRYTPIANLDVNAKFEFAESQTRGDNLVLASETVPNVVTKDRFADGDPFGFPEGEDVTSENAEVTANYHLGDYTLTAITGFSGFGTYRANSYSKDVPAVFLNLIYERFQQYSQEVRLLSPANQTFEYIVGAYVDTSNYDLHYPWIYNLPVGLAGKMSEQYFQSAKTYSVFAQGTYHIRDDLRLLGSLRYTDTLKGGSYHSYLDYGSAIAGPTTATGHINEGNVDPSATLQYDVAPDAMLYATYGRGSKSGGFVSDTFGTTNSTFTFKPEQSANIEVGVKSSLFDNTLVANLTAYDTIFKNLQTSVYDANLVPAGFVTKNAASASSKGVEGNVIWLPIPELKLSWDGAYQDAKYDNFPGANCLARQPTSVCSDTAPANAPNGVANNNLAGFPLTYSSKWSGNFQIEHTLLLGHNLNLTSTLVAAYRSTYYNSDDQSPIYGVQPGYVKYDLRVQLGDDDERWHVALIGKNLSDVKTYSFAFAWPALLSNYPTAMKFLDEPRTISVEAGVNF